MVAVSGSSLVVACFPSVLNSASLVPLHPGIGVSLVPVLHDLVHGDGVEDGLVLLLVVAGLPLLPGLALFPFWLA